MKAIAYWDVDSQRIRKVLAELRAGFEVRLAATLRATGLNIHRATAFKKRQKRYKTGKKSIDSPCNNLISRIREQLNKNISDFS